MNKNYFIIQIYWKCLWHIQFTFSCRYKFATDLADFRDDSVNSLHFDDDKLISAVAAQRKYSTEAETEKMFVWKYLEGSRWHLTECDKMTTLILSLSLTGRKIFLQTTHYITTSPHMFLVSTRYANEGPARPSNYDGRNFIYKVWQVPSHVWWRQMIQETVSASSELDRVGYSNIGRWKKWLILGRYLPMYTMMDRLTKIKVSVSVSCVSGLWLDTQSFIIGYSYNNTSNVSAANI